MNEINNQNMLQVGTILHGTYKIESYLASGGFGNTYLAKNIEFDETYAIKEFFVKGVCQRDGNSTIISVSNAENTNSFEQQREKFKKEARRLRSLSNPHIVKVYDLFEENGTAYYVMDYVDGENLSARLKRTNAPLAESEVRNYLNQILDGLEAIHNEGMFHLDIKPANIMVDSHDVVKLIDFGASKQQSTVGGATMSTGISYTNGYAPSEQMAQSYDKFGPWTDFYALGATMYKLLANQDPPSVSDLSEDETEDKHLALPMPNVSEEMKKLVVWMMQVNRLKRPKNVGEIRKSAEQSVSNIASEGEESTIAINKTNIQCNDETGNGWKRDARRIYDEVCLKHEQANKKAWERLYKECEKRFLKKTRYFTIPVGILFGGSLGVACSVNHSLFDRISSVLFFSVVWGFLLGIGLSYFLYWFTKGYWVKCDVKKVMEEEYPELLSYHNRQIELSKKDYKFNNLTLNCMYCCWPIMIYVVNESLQGLTNGDLWNEVAIGLLEVIVSSFLISWIVSMIIAVFIYVLKRNS